MANRFARPPKKHKDEEEYGDDELTIEDLAPRIAERHLIEMRPLGRPYKTDDEKTEVFVLLVRLKENRKTNQECAAVLGVSTRTVVNYLNDPYYEEMKQQLITEAKQRGHLQIADVIDDAVNKLYRLMNGARSEFVQYKSAEYLLKISGYENMVEERERDNQADVIDFLSKLEKGKRTPVQVNVQINQNGTTGTVVDAQVVEGGQLVLPAPLEDDELAQYLVPMQPGGKIPTQE